ncbi:uncharacterized protein LOC111070981 isoform X2 [Drosophila obscura]|nr:uncharacterized protein LOC111070981 isoform X2 [Drosophila obscura]
MAWVDEGPGPPTCPRSCAEQQPLPQKRTAAAGEGSVSKRSVSSNNKAKYFVNYKTSQMRLGHSNRVMSRVRRERDRSDGDPPVTDIPTTTEADQDDELELELGESAAASSTMASPSSDDADAAAAPTLSYSHLHAQPQIHLDTADQQQQQQPQQGHLHAGAGADAENEEQQQCLDYLGDAAESSAQHLCGLESPAELLKRLRTLRLRNCCERSVFSALHTLALNATLSDRGECVRILSDLLEVDSLANRITCELAEILFRFDCRQVYSLINQCDDCKEAYRRWVCSTLVPYFAEPKDVAPPGTEQSSNAKTPGKNKRSAWSATRTEGGDVAGVAGAGGVNGIKHKSLKLISNNNKSNNGNNMNERQINQKPDKSSKANGNEENTNANGNVNGNVNGDNDRNVEDAIGRDLAQTFYDVVGMSNPHQSQVSDVNGGEGPVAMAAAEAETQSNNFISTANNADPRGLDPVISKLQKRSTRKAEFRKRRRIRPCLSVCQTVEQKCPYLLPADRAPALPTQYAGEPTFLCLDQNIPETGEQLKKSSYGPNDCCYSYCNGPESGVCTVCQDFAPPRASPSDVAANSTRRVHNITLTLSSPPGEHARAKSVALALRNVTKERDSEQDAMESLMERLPYYARLGSIYYYDEDGEMPKAPVSGNCAPVPAVTTRCTFPYYASGTEAAAPPTQLLVWLSALLGLLSSCGAAQRWSCSWSGGCGQRGRGRQCVNCEASCHEQELITSNSNSASGSGSGSGSTNRRSSQQSVDGKCTEKAPQAEAEAEAEGAFGSNAWMWAWSVRPLNTHRQMCSKVRYFSSRSKFKCESRGGRISMPKYRDLDPVRLRVRIRIRIRWSWSWPGGGVWQAREGCTRTINYRYFYYYNYNINDWWRRWWLGEWRIVGSGAL